MEKFASALPAPKCSLEKTQQLFLMAIVLWPLPPTTPTARRERAKKQTSQSPSWSASLSSSVLGLLYNLFNLLRTELVLPLPSSNQIYRLPQSAPRPLCPGTGSPRTTLSHIVLLPPLSSLPPQQQLQLLVAVTSSAALGRICSTLLCPHPPRPVKRCAPARGAWRSPAAPLSPASMTLLSQFPLPGVLLPLPTPQPSTWVEQECVLPG